ncbi:MAG: flagellar basal body P-ring formation protein FlgA [Methylibium sp.]|uniref:flagellar basal body P-ring formation chaperone FlgA n=1 Tax=Methylibium sp. TaxID=2067992 RepID=UPI001816A932|nr:flagellar basal body P-ring formation chaperone FlgA [Methylibium sp.]MBA2722314.1 flagellar basal body P-ring formation protein FlgA [Methylibium sp.]MBA3597630.1 flagellar basal body P-ring formation protein FlgA [Methylibium sp.]
MKSTTPLFSRALRRAAPALLVALLLGAAPLSAEEAPAAQALAQAFEERARSLALESARPADGLRVEIEVGRLNPRLRLAPCEQVEPYLPNGFKPWGRTRVGLRCLSGPKRWNVYLPITVKVFGPALVASSALAAGTVLAEADLQEAEVDLAAEHGAVLTDAQQAVGRTLTRMVSAGDALRSSNVRARQWFAAGDTVRLVAIGTGFSVEGQGRAISVGLDGSQVRVRTESGRIVTGLATGEREVEVRL